MKLIDVAEFYSEGGGGVRTYINQKLTIGAQLGHDVAVVAPGPSSGVQECLGGRIIWIKSPPFPLEPRYHILWNGRAVREVLDREAPDVVEGSSPWTGGWSVARWRGAALRSFVFHMDPVAVYAETLLDRRLDRDHINRLFGWYWGYLRRLSKNYDVTLVSGHWLAKKLASFGLQHPIAVPFGIDKAQFSPARRDPEVRAELLRRCGLDSSAKLLVMVTRFHPEKRLRTVFKAFERARRESPMGLVVYGHGFLESMVHRAARKIPGLHLAGYTKDRDELASALASADLMVHGSAAETYGLAIAEGICSGLPIVVPSVGGAADLADERCAATYEPGDVAGMSRAILELLDRDRAELRAAASSVAESKITTMRDHFVGLFARYEALLSSR